MFDQDRAHPCGMMTVFPVEMLPLKNLPPTVWPLTLMGFSS